MSITLHSSTASQRQEGATTNPLPTLLQTPSGLALLELQGTINIPERGEEDETRTSDNNDAITAQEISIGRLVFPDWDAKVPDSTAWMKRVYLYVGKHQRLTGQVKKLPNAIAVIRKKADESLPESNGEKEGREEEHVDLEIVEIVKYKILFSIRPEPVGTVAAEE